MPEPIMPSTSISVPSPLGRGQVIGELFLAGSRRLIVESIR